MSDVLHDIFGDSHYCHRHLEYFHFLEQARTQLDMAIYIDIVMLGSKFILPGCFCIDVLASFQKETLYIINDTVYAPKWLVSFPIHY